MLPSFSAPIPTAPEVWVNAAWAGTSDGTVVDAQGHVFGVNATDTISNGSGMVAAHGTVHVAAGIYNENVVIDHPLVLSGANAGMPANGTRSDESIINGSSGIGIDVAASDVTVDGFLITGFTQEIRFTGDDTIITNNVIDCGDTMVSYPVYGTGDHATFVNNNIYWAGGMEALTLYGDNANISRNLISVPPVLLDLADTVTPDGGFIFNQGNDSVIADNHVGGFEWYAPDGIQAIGDNVAISGNNVTIGSCDNSLIKVQGNNARVSDNVLKAFSVAYESIYVAGNDGIIDGNTVELSYSLYSIISYMGGSNGVITDNVIDVNMPDIPEIEATEYYGMYSMIGYEGVAGTIERNRMTTDKPFECGISYADGSLYGAPTGSATFPANGGIIADNTFSAPLSAGFIYYFGDAGTIRRNTDLSENESEWPLVVYEATLFGHGTITDNTGGPIIYMGDLLGLAPYGTISNNHVNSSTIGIAAIGDYNVINNNEINATVGTYTLGTKVLIDSNVYNAMSEFTFESIPLSAGAIFDGDMCTVNNNIFNNNSIAVANVGLFQVIGLSAGGAVASEDSDKVNATLESSAADIAALQEYAKGCVDKYAPAGVSAADTYAAELSSLGYRGYGNSVTGNTLNYDNSLGILGIASLGYDFTVDSNTFNIADDSIVIAGMIVGGDGGMVTNNDLSDVTVLGMYYGGLLKFEEGLYTSDLLGMDAQITGNTIDNTNGNNILTGIFPWGIIFTGYNAAIEDNDLLGLGLGILTVQFEGSIVNNDIDAYSDGDYIMPLSVDSVSARTMEYDGVSGLGGIISVCNNLTVTDNLVNGTILGMLFVPIDPYTTWGNAYIVDNTLTNNAIQLAVVPSYFKVRLSDGTVSPIDNATLQRIMGENTLDRTIYITDNTNELWALDIADLGYFQVDALAVYGSLNIASLAAILVDGDGYTVHVSPGYYRLFMPVIVARSNLTYLGDIYNPGKVVVDASSLSLMDSAFEIWADNDNVTGFAITTLNPGDCGIAVGRLGSLLSLEAEVNDQSIVDDILDDLMDMQVSNTRISNNVISNFASGIYLDNCTYTDITYNRITCNYVGVYLTNKSLSNSTEIHYNDFVRNLYYGVNYNDTTAVPDPEEDLWVNAENNWWGDVQGPYDVTNPESTSTGDCVTYYVLYEPWLTSPVYASSYTYHLVAGWNLISVPLDVEDSSITGFFPANVLDGVDVIWGWDESVQNWKLYSSDPNEAFFNAPYNYPHLTSIDAGRTYWVYSDQAVSFSVVGTVPSSAPASPVSFVHGWNFVGPTGLDTQSVTALYPGADVVWGWDESVQNWKLYSSDPNEAFFNAPYNYPHLTEALPGHGYWVYMGTI